jgi:hypothetical protein
VTGLCRCGDLKPSHITWQWNVATIYDRTNCMGFTFDDCCSCSDYVPKDNLEYLELIYTKKVGVSNDK